MDIAEKIFPLPVIERLREVGQNSRVPEPQQGATAIREPHVELELQQLREAIQVLRRDQPGHAGNVAFERGQLVDERLFDAGRIDQPGSSMSERGVRCAREQGEQSGRGL